MLYFLSFGDIKFLTNIFCILCLSVYLFIYLCIYLFKSYFYCSGCDKCAEWFHGDCINLRKSEAKKVEEWYCKACLGIETN